ncbi:MAG: HAD-IA family hydrolase [Planctomycetota bacterium]|nr:HAD-IA family hydrolase [Planctomycetota bacterium]
MSKPYILFDVMDTLVFDPAYTVLPKLLERPISKVWSDANPEAWPAFERGEIDEAEYFQNFFLDRRPIDGSLLKQELIKNYRWLPGMEPLLLELQAQSQDMHILSNYPIWYRDIEEKLELSKYLPWTFVSHKTGRRKPSPESYLEASKQLRSPLSAGLFIDDRESNCQAAKKLGMDAIRFENAEQLRGELRQRKLID